MEEIWDLDRHGKQWQQIKPLTLSAQAWSNQATKSRREASLYRRSGYGAKLVELDWHYNQIDSYFDVLQLTLVGDLDITEGLIT